MNSLIQEMEERFKELLTQFAEVQEQKLNELRNTRAHKVKALATWEGCDQMFSYKGNMEKHIKAVHEGTKKFSCTWEGCDQMFSQAGQ